MHAPMPDGVRLSTELPDWVKLAIGNAVVVFGRMEQEVIEISWILSAADLRLKQRLARNPATDNFAAVLEILERAKNGWNLGALKDGFNGLANERNLIVHGAWVMTDDKPWVVWHKFLEDDESVIGEYFENWRFEKFMVKANCILNMLRGLHNLLEKEWGVKTTAVPRDS